MRHANTWKAVQMSVGTTNGVLKRISTVRCAGFIPY